MGRCDSNAYCIDLGSTPNGDITWYPADKLHIVAWQPIKGLVPPAFTDAMLRKATRYPAQNTDLILSKALSQLAIVKDDNTFYAVSPYPL